ncbi:MAG TPA: alpha/beta fold hydrolase [Gemmatimonadota bacterium]|nr:alpha/beta fold hydrolase [Gemmatimonadota bacterium]
MSLRAEACYFRGADGALVHFDARNAGGRGPARAACLTLHGLGEHLGKYAEWTKHATGRGYHVTAYDQRGHGRTRGRRGDFTYGDLVSDLEQFVAVTADRYPGEPVFILGHSLGALVALSYAGGEVHTAVRGMALSGPPIVLAGRIPTWYEGGVRLLARAAPRVPLRRGADYSRVTRDIDRAAEFRRDPLIHRFITPRAMIGITAAMEAVRKTPEKVTLPLLFLVARADSVVSGGDVLAYAHFVASKDVTIEQFPGAYHELLNDLGRRAVYDSICGWFDAHAG